jgi:hypothetical protein
MIKRRAEVMRSDDEAIRASPLQLRGRAVAIKTLATSVASDFLIYNEESQAKAMRRLRSRIHKNSIFCLSKLIKSNEWDFLPFAPMPSTQHIALLCSLVIYNQPISNPGREETRMEQGVVERKNHGSN